jgi:predicted ATPase
MRAYAVRLRRLPRIEFSVHTSVAPHISYLFKHALVQDAAYSTLLRGPRQRLHGRIAAVLEDKFP